MTEKELLPATHEEAEHLAAEMREIKEAMLEIFGKLNRLEARMKRVFPSAFPNLSEPEGFSEVLIEEEDIVAMANDPQIQAEIAAINEEFAVTDMDGLEGL
jgi:hypothetical protein